LKKENEAAIRLLVAELVDADAAGHNGEGDHDYDAFQP
jgi:hypothetical protein